jgi:hypothetical protein
VSERTPEVIRSELERERDELAHAADELRGSLGEALDVTGKLRAKLPIAAGAALGAGFILSGGIGATMRLLMRRSREGTTKAQVGRFRLVDRD